MGFGRALLRLCVPGVIAASRLKLKAKGFGFFGVLFVCLFPPTHTHCAVEFVGMGVVLK